MNNNLNSGLSDEYRNFCSKIIPSTAVTEEILTTTSASIELGRRFEAKYYGFLRTQEDDIDIALQTDGVDIDRDNMELLLLNSSTEAYNYGRPRNEEANNEATQGINKTC